MSGWRIRGKRHEQVEIDMVPMLADGDAFDRFLAQQARRLVELRKIEDDRVRGVAAGNIVSIFRGQDDGHNPYEEVHAAVRILDTLFQRDGESWLDEIHELAEEIESPTNTREPGQLRVVYVDLEPRDSAPGN